MSCIARLPPGVRSAAIEKALLSLTVAAAPGNSLEGMVRRCHVGYNRTMDGNGFAGTLRQLRTRHKISQLELAERAGTTQRYVSFIEGGRSMPGRNMVVRLAEALDLPLRDRNGLLMACGYAPAYPESSLEDSGLRPVLGALRHVLDGHLPYPAIVINRFGVLIAANRAFDMLTEGISPELLEPPVNVYRLALHPLGMAPRVRNLAALARHVRAGLRQESLRDPAPELESLLEELERYVPTLGQMVASDDLGFAVPVRLDSPFGTLQLITTIATFATALDVTVAELRLEAFLPADTATASVLAGLSPRRQPVTEATPT